MYDLRNPEEYIFGEIAKLRESNSLYKQWLKEYDEMEGIDAFFERYPAGTKTKFLSSYITKKYLWHQQGDLCLKKHQERKQQWIYKAYEHLGAILQKKLFDMQCLWKAEQVTIKEIEISFDFEIWEQNVLNCPFIDLITEDEIRMYQDFLMQDDLDIDDTEFDGWQGHYEIKKGYTISGLSHYVPAWYDYHNRRTGENLVLTLEDIRGKKEDFYADLARQYELEINNGIDKHHEPFHLFNFTDKDLIEFFVTTFDDETTQQKYFEFKEKFLEFDQEEEDYEEAIIKNRANFQLLRKMNELDELVAVPSDDDFKQALAKGYSRYCSEKIAKLLPIVYQLYLTTKKTGLIFKCKKIQLLELRDEIKEEIIQGRRLNGEAPNLKF